MKLESSGSIFTKRGRIAKDNTIDTDLLVIGSGLGGLWSAWAALDSGLNRVAIVDKCSIGESSQSKMSAGATVYCTKRDPFDLWFKELVEQQKYLSRQDMVEDMLKTSGQLLEKQKEWGLWYEKMPWGSPTLHVGGTKNLKMHVLPRYKGIGGGGAIVNVIKDQVLAKGGEFYSKVMITGLLHSQGKVCGAVGVDRMTGETLTFKSRGVVIATADCSFGNTGCIGHSTGDGYKLAYDMGARLTNMEFWGSNTGSPQYSFESISDTAANFGCRFYNNKGQYFTHKYTSAGDKAEPFKIAQAMADEAENGGGPPYYFDMRSLAWRLGYQLVLKRKMTGFVTQMFEELKRQGIDPFERPMEWVPLMRTIRGGIRTDMNCMTDIPGLFAAGTAQALDPNGLNGISTVRAMWSGQQAGRQAARYINGSYDIKATGVDNLSEARSLAVKPLKNSGAIKPVEVIGLIQMIVFPYNISLKKDSKSLLMAIRAIRNLKSVMEIELAADSPHELSKAHEAMNMTLTAELYLTASLLREESRGDHYREDYQKTDNKNWLKWINLKNGGNGNIATEIEPVPLNKYKLDYRGG
ncbi:MAG: FAD-binding protein [Clostridia bacterium]|nr:FAD-binding protein [Clostridia bacterium]